MTSCHWTALLGRLLMVAGACGIACSRAPGDGAPSSGNGYPAPPKPSGPACGQDEVKEWLCGNSSDKSPAGCGSTAERLTAYGPAHLSVTGQWGAAHDPRLAPLRFDPAATETYRKTVGPTPTPLSEYCCYAGCIRLEVAADVPRDLPPDHVETERCIDAPGGGTSRPAAAPRCPTAVKLEGEFRSFRHGTDTSCCYTIPRPRPPAEPMHPKGRPLNVGGVPRVAALVRNRDW
jgi:hypothetical protein